MNRNNHGIKIAKNAITCSQYHYVFPKLCAVFLRMVQKLERIRILFLITIFFIGKALMTNYIVIYLFIYSVVLASNLLDNFQERVKRVLHKCLLKLVSTCWKCTLILLLDLTIAWVCNIFTLCSHCNKLLNGIFPHTYKKQTFSACTEQHNHTQDRV